MNLRLLLSILLLPLAILSAQDPEKPEKVDLGPEYRKFTAKNGKVLVAKVVARIDEKTYTFETPEGQSYKMALTSFAASDQQWLEFWQPDFVTDLTKIDLKEALEKMGFEAVSLTAPAVGLIVQVTVGDADLKLLFDPKAKNTILDIEPADRAGLDITDSNSGFQDQAGNKIQSKKADNASFKFGNADPIEASVLVIDLSLIGGAKIQKEADGILGADLLSNLEALVDFSGKTLYVKP